MNKPNSTVKGRIGFIYPIWLRSVKSKAKKATSKIKLNAIVRKITRFCRFLFIISVYAINQANSANGINAFPIIKYHTMARDSSNIIFIIKLIESGNHGFATPIHEIPTKIYNLDLNLEYFRRIEIPIETEIKTKIKLNKPCKKSTNSSAKTLSLVFYLHKICVKYNITLDVYKLS
jgi:hypothetical protein